MKNDTKFAKLHLWQLTPIRDFFWISLAIFILVIGYHLRAIFTPVLIALALAYLFNPLINWLEEKVKVSRSFTILSLIAVLVIVGFAVFIWTVPLVLEQLSVLSERAPGYLATIGQRLNLETGEMASQFSELLRGVRENPTKVLRALFVGTSGAFGFIGGVLGTTIYMLGSAFLVLVYFAFFAWKFEAITKGWAKYIPAQRRERFLEILGMMDRTVSSFFRGRVLISLLMAAMFSVGWLFADVPYWFLLGTGTGLLNLIPYLSAVGWPLAILLKYLDVVAQTGGDFSWMAVLFWPSLVYIVVQLMEGWVLTPWIQGQSTNLSAMTILLVIMIGGALAGLYGLLLAIPFAACLNILLHEVFLPKIESWAKET